MSADQNNEAAMISSLQSERVFQEIKREKQEVFVPQVKPITIFQRLNRLRKTEFLTTTAKPVLAVDNSEDGLEKKGVSGFTRVVSLLTEIFYLLGESVKAGEDGAVVINKEILDGFKMRVTE